MDRKEFKNLNDEDRINWILDRYKEGYNNADIVRVFDIPKNTIGDTMRRNGYISNRLKGIYETSDTSQIRYSQEKIFENVIQERDEEGELLKEMFKWYQEQKNNENETKKVLSWAKKKMDDEKSRMTAPKIDRNKLVGSINMETVTVYEDILKEFYEFCKKKGLTHQDALSMCMVEYMEKYN